METERLKNICKLAQDKHAAFSKQHQNFYAALKDTRAKARRLVKSKPSAEVKAALAYIEAACDALAI